MKHVNYWFMSKDRKREFTDELLNDFRKLIKASTVAIGNGTGFEGTQPILEKKRIVFNGIEKDAHESFSIYIDDTDDMWTCMTDKKPYDLLVKGLLMLLDEYGYISNWSFDGDTTDSCYVHAKNLYNSTFNKA